MLGNTFRRESASIFGAIRADILAWSEVQISRFKLA
jgi:hypothetical protein